MSQIYLKTQQAVCGRNFSVKLVEDYDQENPLTNWDFAADVIFQPSGYCYHGKNNQTTYRVFTTTFSGFGCFDPKEYTDTIAAYGSFGDRGHTVYLGITKTKALQESGHKRFNQHTQKYAEMIVKAEAATMQQYVDGEVWGYVVKELDSEGKDLDYQPDSMWGMYGREYAESEALAALVSVCTEADKEAVETAACYI